MSVFDTTVGGLFTTWLSKEFIRALEFELQYWKFTNKNVIPAGSGKIGQVNVFSNPPGSSTALTEGTTTGGEITNLTTTATAVTISEYGEFFPVSSLSDYAAVDGTRKELAARMAYGGAFAVDKIILAALDAAAATKWFSTATGTGQTTDPATLGTASASTLIGAAKQARDNAVRGFRDVPGHDRDALACIMSPAAELDMVTEFTTGRLTWAQAVTNVGGTLGQEKVIIGKMGTVYGTGCYRSQNATFWNRGAGSTSASGNYLLGDGAIASMSFSDMNPQVYINTPSSGDIGNPYRNRYTIAWHLFFGVAVGPDALAKNRIVRYYTSGK